jgi:threonine/homoserine/homoserine lactone efflux protein
VRRRSSPPGAPMGTVITAALGIAVSPLPALAVAALLGSSGTLRAASAFVAGEALAVGTIAALIVAIAANSLKSSLESTLALMELGVAVLLALLLVAHLRMGQDKAASARVLAALDGIRPQVAFACGVGMVALNPKNFALTLAGGTAILELDQTGGLNAAAVIAFTTVAVSLLIAEVVAYGLAPRHAAMMLARARELMLRHERTVATAILLVLILFFSTRGLFDLLR